MVPTLLYSELCLPRNESRCTINACYSLVMVTSWHGNPFRTTGPLWGQCDHWWILTQRASTWCFLCCWPNMLSKKQWNCRWFGDALPLVIEKEKVHDGGFSSVVAPQIVMMTVMKKRQYDELLFQCMLTSPPQLLTHWRTGAKYALYPYSVIALWISERK